MGPAVPAMTIISGVYGIYSGIQQGKEASKAAANTEEQARREASLIEAQTREEASRFRDASDEALASNRAKAAASGLRDGGSQSIFQGREEDKFAQELDWILKSGSSRAGLARESGRNAADALKSQGDAAMWGGIAGGIKDIGTGIDDGGWW